MKKFWKTTLGVAFACSIITLSACGSAYNPSNNVIPFSGLDGLKTIYSDGEYEVDDTFEIYSQHILTEIYANFAVPSTESHKSKLENKPLTSVVTNYDKIRVQQKAGVIRDDFSWKWKFSTSCDGCPCVYEIDDVISSYENEITQNKYYDEWLSVYTIPLEIVCLQIAMGETPQTFVVDISGNTTTIYANQAKTTKVDSTYLATILEDFKSKGVYVGFTEEDVEIFKDYILTNIVGDVIIGTEFDTITMSDGKISYSQLLDNILALETGLEHNFYTPYPTGYVNDVTDTSFFAGETNHVLDHVNAQEYKSATLIINKDTKIAGFYIAFESTYDLTLDVYVTYYNHSSGTITSYNTQTFEISAGTFNGEDWKMFNLNGELTLPKFNNELVSAISPTKISKENENTKYFAYSQYGAIVDGSQLNCDCFTVSFVPQKTQAGYYPFKWVIDLEMEG